MHEPRWRVLARLMSEVSEEAWCAGWMDGLEYALWAMVCGGDRKYGQITVDEKTVDELYALSQLCNGWVRFGEHAEEYVPLDEWKRLYDERQSHAK